MGLLHPPPARGSVLGQRGMVLIAIGGLHVLAVAGLLHAGLRPPAAAEAPVLQAVFLSAEPQPQAPRPELQPEFEPPPVQLPVMQLPAIQTPAEATAITVAWVSEPPREAAPRPVSNVDANVPVPVETVDYLDQVRPQYP